MALINMMKSINRLVPPLMAASGADAFSSIEKFNQILDRERARSDRNGHGFSVISYVIKPDAIYCPSTRLLLRVLPKRIRITDEIGWVDDERIGILLYSASQDDARIFAEQIDEKIKLSTGTSPRFTIYAYPAANDWPGNGKGRGVRDESKNSPTIFVAGNNPTPDIILATNHRIPRWKRLMDMAGACLGLIVCAPLFLLIAVYIKTVSPGPVFFRQERIGLGGKPFVFWKFRTMKVDVDTTAHQQLLAELIKGGGHSKGGDKPMTKLDHDPQIIPFGKILRKTCIDELPQLINVLLGDMSLIGPRPPIRYEVDNYDRWHQARLATTPGMTGLWQVSGKNKLTFREMVRLDIRYLRKRSMWQDLKIFFLTPRAIFSQMKDTL
jgi:lipopolysaccharide/colanic/teichoic acid biosynthesis glycosyltransferase